MTILIGYSHQWSKIASPNVDSNITISITNGSLPW